ncbi:hypothetical protein LCGC14_2317520 [marine sediment metagenome]|uniref:Uncharacterized protein n=1 Tax=marine sediment metagenome TaxID=412755 RepID=A0A0F9FDL6_9ZZZZ
MTDTETKLKQAKKDRDLALAEANNEVDRLAKLVAEEKKPKLRHGDYCQTSDKEHTYVALYSRKDIYDFEIWGKNDYGIYVNGSIKKDNTHYTPTGLSIFTDLKAIKPLANFKVKCSAYNESTEFYARIDANKRVSIEINDNGQWCWATLDELDKIILNLRGMQLKLNQDKEKT